MQRWQFAPYSQTIEHVYGLDMQSAVKQQDIEIESLEACFGRKKVHRTTDLTS